jgi:predicted MFS family arabinose efflux permease
VGWAGAGAAFAVAAALSVAAVLLLARLHEPPRAPLPRRHPLHDLRQGAAFVWQHRLLRPILLTAVAWNTAWFVLQAAYVPYAMQQLGMTAAGVGSTLAMYGVGMVLGALAAGRVIRALPYGQAVLLGPLVSVLAAFTMAASTLWPQPALAALSFFLFGVGPIVWTITSTTLRQQVTSQALLGRVGAIFLTVNAGVRPLGALLGGWVGARYGAAACLWLAAGVLRAAGGGGVAVAGAHAARAAGGGLRVTPAGAPSARRPGSRSPASRAAAPRRPAAGRSAAGPSASDRWLWKPAGTLAAGRPAKVAYSVTSIQRW